MSSSTDQTRPLKVVKTDAEWREQLTPIQYQITRQHGTERAFQARTSTAPYTAPIVVFAVTGHSTSRKRNTSPALAGRASFSRSNQMPSQHLKITPTV